MKIADNMNQTSIKPSRDKIRILFVETGNYGGGSFESMYLNITQLDRERFEPIVCYLNDTIYVNKLKKLGVEVHVIGDLLYNNWLPNVLKRILVRINWIIGALSPSLQRNYESVIHGPAIRCLKRIISDRNVDIIHLNNTMVRHFFAIVGLRNEGVPIISYLRSFIDRGATASMAEFSNRHVVRYVAYSEGVKAFWIKSGVASDNVEIISNGIHIDAIEPLDVWQRIGIGKKGGPLIGCVGAIKANRGYDFMLRSFARILSEEPEAFLVIVGSSMDKNVAVQLERLVESLGIQDSIRLHGFDPEGIRIIAGLDVLTIPFRVEPFGRILLEAWLARTPVVATRVGCIEQIIHDGYDGLLVDYGDEKAMSAAVLRIFRKEKFRRFLVNNGRETVEQRFSIQISTRKLEQLYTNVVRPTCFSTHC